MGCSKCRGFGHKTSECPTPESSNSKQLGIVDKRVVKSASNEEVCDPLNVEYKELDAEDLEVDTPLASLGVVHSLVVTQ